MIYKMIDGSPVDKSRCLVPDHYEQAFVVTIRSLSPVSEQQVKNLIQSKYEVKHVLASELIALVK